MNYDKVYNYSSAVSFVSLFSDGEHGGGHEGGHEGHGKRGPCPLVLTVSLLNRILSLI